MRHCNSTSQVSSSAAVARLEVELAASAGLMQAAADLKQQMETWLVGETCACGLWIVLVVLFVGILNQDSPHCETNWYRGGMFPWRNN